MRGLATNGPMTVLTADRGCPVSAGEAALGGRRQGRAAADLAGVSRTSRRPEGPATEAGMGTDRIRGASEGDPAIAAFLEHLRRERGASSHTIRGYEGDLAVFRTFLDETAGGSATLSADPKRVRAYSAWLSGRGYAAGTIARRLASLRSFFRYQRRGGAVASDPTATLRNPKQPRRLPRAIRVEDVIRFLDSIPTTSPLDLRDRAMFETLYGGGLRVAELVGLDLDDLDFERVVVRVRGKGRRERLAPVGPEALDWLTRWLAVRRPDRAVEAAVFLNRYGRRLSTRSVDRIFQGRLPGLGLDPNACPHSLRHSFATPPAGWRGRPPERPGVAGPPSTDHHAGLHPRLARTADRGLSEEPPAPLTTQPARCRLDPGELRGPGCRPNAEGRHSAAFVRRMEQGSSRPSSKPADGIRPPRRNSTVDRNPRRSPRTRRTK